MMCGPVFTQWLPFSGFVAYGSVLLASVPPASMYIRPTFPAGGVWCPIQACAQAIAFASRHIGSGPGVVGLSGMQVQPLLPLRSVRMLAPSIATIVAFLETLIGAAFIALATSWASVGAAAAFFMVMPFIFSGALSAADAVAVKAERRSTPVRMGRRCMMSSLSSRRFVSARAILSPRG